MEFRKSGKKIDCASTFDKRIFFNSDAMHFMNFDNLFTHFSDYICYYSNHARASFFRDENGSLAVLIYSSYNYYELCPWRKVMAAYR